MADIVLIPVIIFAVAFTAIFIHVILTAFHGEVSGTFTTEAETLITQGLTAMEQFDTGIMLLIGGIFLVTIIGAFFIDTHPIFFVAAFLLLVVSIIVGSQITNLYMTFATASPTITASANNFPLTYLFFTNLPIFLLFMGAALSIILYGKFRSGGTY